MASSPYGPMANQLYVPSQKTSTVHHPSIKFTASWSAEEVNSLDTRVYLKDSQIGTDLHVKPTDRHQFLRMNNCQTKHCNSAIPYSQALRLQRICLKDEDLVKRVHDLKNQLLKCGYEQHLHYELQRALDMPRDMCLQSKRNQDKSAQTPLVVTYHPTLPSFHRTTKHHLATLHASE